MLLGFVGSTLPMQRFAQRAARSRGAPDGGTSAFPMLNRSEQHDLGFTVFMLCKQSLAQVVLCRGNVLVIAANILGKDNESVPKSQLGVGELVLSHEHRSQHRLQIPDLPKRCAS